MYSYAFSLFFMYGDLDSVIFVMIVETLLWAIGAIFVTLLTGCPSADHQEVRLRAI